MKTSVELNEKKVELARKLGPTASLRQLLDKALDAYIAERRRGVVSELLGTSFFEGDLTIMRANRGRVRR